MVMEKRERPLKMARSFTSYMIFDFTFHGVFLLPLLLLVLQFSSQLANCGSIVKYLPGFQGPLPFLLETGYIGVGEDDDVQSFYYFIESENNPKVDPLMLWLTGGPGCSAFSGLVFEIGPLTFKNEEYNGSLPNLYLKPHSWTKVSNIIFVDLPVLTGFSYARTDSAAQRSDCLLVNQTHQFLRKWLIEHPKFLSHEIYIGGDSYSGIPIPAVVQEISQGNEEGVQPWINLQGYLLGNPVTTRTEKNYKIPFAHGMALISDELYNSLQKNCKGDYINIDTENVLCSRDIVSFNKAIEGLNSAQILDPLCEYITSPKPEKFSWRRALTENKYSRSFLAPPLTLPPLSCRSYAYFLCTYWANDDSVHNALHIRKGSIGEWHRCTWNIPHKLEIYNSFEYHVNLSQKGYRSLIYSGDHDITVPFLSTQAWIRSLNYSIVEDWRQWQTNGQVAGYTRTYSNRMTFATVKASLVNCDSKLSYRFSFIGILYESLTTLHLQGGGHTAPEFKPEECFAMYSRWISKRPL
ncbi:serine carboxypeptidase-like 12 [Arachis ipaensis]|uniref:serine carboxypeptidase-like 12 n=1 Tax=Arachis ipaensis TaxID=130454 RepID=UPI000A2B0B75|nr:serine carboxypeptidase-like 12 [Arachis ipaensis]